MVVTEFAIMPLASGVTADKGSKGLQVMLDSFAALQDQPGVGQMYYGTDVEDPSTFYMIIDWDKLEDHHVFMKTEGYPAFLKHFGQVLDGNASLHHVNFPHAPTAQIGKPHAPATEILTVYFPTDFSSADQKKFEDSFKAFCDAIRADWKGTFEVITGWVIEELDYEKAPGGKAKAWRALIAWDSVHAHHECQETEVFKNGVHVVRQAPGSVGRSLIHIEGVVYQPS